MNSKQLKLVAAPAGTVSEGPELTLGETSTETVAPTSLETTFVTPPVTAEPPEGFSMG